MTNTVRRFQTSGPIVIEVHNKAGEVCVELTDTDTTTVEFAVAGDTPAHWLQEIWGTLGGAGRPPFDEPSIDRAVADFVPADESGGPGRLFVDTGPARAGWHSRIDVRMSAPRSSEARIDGQSTDVRVTGTVGSLTVRTASGDVTAGECAADVRVTSASGDVVLGPVAGGAVIRTVAGDVRARSVAGRTVVQSTSGNVRLGPSGSDVVVRTVSGNVTVAAVRRGTTRVATVSGDVDIAVHRGTLASIGLASTTGQIRSDLTVEQRPPADPNDAGGNPRGRADADIRVRTISGNVQLRRSADATEPIPD